MDVYLIPIGADRYDLYCEVDDSVAEPAAERPKGLFKRLRHAFGVMLAEAEEERRHGSGSHATTWFGRIKAKVMRWVAESIAEQRLLWHLRRQREACLFHPDDIDRTQAIATLRVKLNADFERHRLWLTLDSLGLVASALLILLPGPNVIGYYFAFRVVGHYLSVRGARAGLALIDWRSEGSAALTRLRAALPLDGEARAAIVGEVADGLGLEHLRYFFSRVAGAR